MNHQEARERIKIVPTKMLQTAYRGLVRLQDKRLSAGATSYGSTPTPPDGKHCGCILTVAAIQHHNKKKRISSEMFQKKLTRYDIYKVIMQIDPSMTDAKAEDVNGAMFGINDNYRSLTAVRHSVKDQRERYVFVKDVLTAELTARKALPVSKKAVAA